jgi:hypothetical protein
MSSAGFQSAVGAIRVIAHAKTPPGTAGHLQLWDVSKYQAVISI